MTRKRFTKLLMAMGLTRNTAQACAATAREEYGNYAAGLDAYITLLLKICREAAEEILPLITAQVEAILAAGGGGHE